MIYDATHSVTATTYNITVGAGGTNPTGGSAENRGITGSFSAFYRVTTGDENLYAPGGGGGGGSANGQGDGLNGGSGGGGGGAAGINGAGGTSTASGYSALGYAGASASGTGGGFGAGGGGGAGGAGGFKTGGIGVSNSITGTPVTYATGGSGTDQNGTCIGNTILNGTGNGGNGQDYSCTPTTGSSGVVIISFVTAHFGTCTATGTYTTFADGANTVFKFTDNGTITLVPLSIFPTRYWVGGTGTWDSSSTTHWSTTSGGAGGADAPFAETPVIIDSNSGAGTITLTTGVAYSLNFTGYTGTFAGSVALSLAGDLTLGSGMTNSYTGALTFAGANQTLTSNGKTLLSALTVSPNGTTTLADNTICSSITLTTGTISLGATTVTLTGTGSVWNVTGGTVSAGTSTIKLNNASSSGKTFVGFGQTYNNLWLTGAGSGAFTITGSNVFADFKCDTPPHTINFTAGTTTSISTFTVNGTAGNLMKLQSTASGTPWKITKNTSGFVSCDYLSIQDSLVI